MDLPILKYFYSLFGPTTIFNIYITRRYKIMNVVFRQTMFILILQTKPKELSHLEDAYGP